MQQEKETENKEAEKRRITKESQGRCQRGHMTQVDDEYVSLSNSYLL